jgi:erythromycin esterase-like protein
MSRSVESKLSAIVRDAAHVLTGEDADYDPLLELVGDARVVLLGEASHGTREFYRERARITRRLVLERGFAAVAAEADWPDAYRVNRYLRGTGERGAGESALGGFTRFPTWMWRNVEVLEFVEWLRAVNDARPAAERVGFYGLDLYSLYTSVDAVLNYLNTVDPAAAGEARQRYACFDHFGDDSQAYGYATAFGLSPSCEAEATRQLVEIRTRAFEYARRDGLVAEEEFFSAEQNARLIKNAEEYYRAMFGSRISSWNVRDRHMAETLDALIAHLERRSGTAKVVVWEHNSHLGDARATEMGEHGELNVGQLVRERYRQEAVLVGFSTYAGTVTAASDWGAPAERKRVRPALPGSYESVFHEANIARFLLCLRDAGGVAEALRGALLERAIGVIYRPDTERISHYFHARLPEQFDAIVHIDHTQALEPLERTALWESGEAPETFPSGL